MKKVVLLAAIGLLSFGSLTANASAEPVTVLKEEAEFKVYCDGVYAGTASTIEEAIEMCN